MGKWIKKVTATPLGLVGHIIDSLTGSSTNNAPSIRAVNEGLENNKAIYVHSSKAFTSQTITAGTTTATPKQFAFSIDDFVDTEGHTLTLERLTGLKFALTQIDRGSQTGVGLVITFVDATTMLDSVAGDKIYIDAYITNPTSADITLEDLQISGLLIAYR